MKRIFQIILFWVGFINAAGAADPVLLIFGGRDHDVFLGTLNTSKHEESSIWNKYGDYGSKYSDKAIWNKYGDYGGKYADYSPFNPYSVNPPVLVDKDGNFFGYFTASVTNPKRTRVKLALFILGNWEKIGEDVTKYYDLVFD